MQPGPGSLLDHRAEWLVTQDERAADHEGPDPPRGVVMNIGSAQPDCPHLDHDLPWREPRHLKVLDPQIAGAVQYRAAVSAHARPGPKPPGRATRGPPLSRE